MTHCHHSCHGQEALPNSNPHPKSNSDLIGILPLEILTDKASGFDTVIGPNGEWDVFD